MPDPAISSFYAHTLSAETHLTHVLGAQPFALSWACANTVRLRMIGPGGVVFDQRDTDFIGKQRSWQFLQGITDAATFLLSATGSEEQTTSQYLTLFVPGSDKTFRNLAILSTLTLEKPGLTG
ncbi:hypothetical protein OG413_25210 [Streptomyces sp. NBC_01433]|uniref:hypothetical protein n=1 Tax=Streptomyces sp. NBC_01433 TaxID=2903864 RepID=UPI00224F86EF|nr:hypothetical protein [Streptomyces sp. NBC_01433]MCX4678566.1 hypothetical protein [Streptomyces sp. NBC_01433]